MTPRALWLVSGIVLGIEITLAVGLAVSLAFRRWRKAGRDLMALIDATREEHDLEQWERELGEEQAW